MKLMLIPPFFWFPFLFSLIGILPNRIIQPIAEHSEYPVERLGNISSLIYWETTNFFFFNLNQFLAHFAHDYFSLAEINILQL